MSLGPTEIVLVLVVALVVLGPDKLPQAARTAAKYLAEFRKFSSNVQTQIDDALRLADQPKGPSQEEPAGNPPNPDISGFKLIDDPRSGSAPPTVDAPGAVPDSEAPPLPKDDGSNR